MHLPNRELPCYQAFLNSEKAIQINIVIIRTFVLIRRYALSFDKLSEKNKQLEKTITAMLKDVFEALEYLVPEKQQQQELKNRNRIWF